MRIPIVIPIKGRVFIHQRSTLQFLSTELFGFKTLWSTVISIYLILCHIAAATVIIATCNGALCGGFPKLGVPFWGPYNKDYRILGSILGPPPIVGNYHFHRVTSPKPTLQPRPATCGDEAGAYGFKATSPHGWLSKLWSLFGYPKH